MSRRGSARTVRLMSRLPLTTLLAAGGLAMLFAGPAAAATTPKTVGGPYGVGVVKPAATAPCDQELRLGVRFTKASKRAGVREVRVQLRGTKTGLTVPYVKPRFTTVRLSPACGTTVTVEYRVTRKTKTMRKAASATKRYRVVIAARPAAPTTPGGVPQEPGGPPPLPAASAKDPDGVRTWLALADLRSGGSRKGQTCVQTAVDSPEGRSVVGSTFCGLPEEDAVVAATTALNGRTVVSGVVGTQVTGLTITGPFGTQTITPSKAEDASDEAGEIIAVYDAAAVAPEQVQLQATLADGRVLTFTDIRRLNWRSASGARI